MFNRYEVFTLLVNNINRSIKKIQNEAMKEFNLKSRHVSCIYYLYKKETLTATELKEICDVDKAAISRTLEFLEENEYIKCSSQAKKRYKSEFSLTEKGIEIGKFVSSKIDEILEKSSFGLSKEKLEIFYEGLNVINENLNKMIEKEEE